MRGLNPHNGIVQAREWFDVRRLNRCQRFVRSTAAQLDVYVGVAPRIRREGGKDAIRHSWLIYVDCDTDEAAARARDFTPQATMLVRSGTGDNVHAYWALAEPISPLWFERANRRLAHHLGSDIKVTDAARILRPPGSLNHKHEPPVMVTVEHVERESRTIPVVRLVGHLPDPPTRHREPRPPRINPIDREVDPLLSVSADHYYTALTGRELSRGNVQCPFHGDGQERNPSMRLYDDTWYCFGCCRGGSIYEFGAALWDMGTRGADFRALRERLTQELGL